MPFHSRPESIQPKLTENAEQVLKARYLLRDENGQVVVETPARLFRRVAHAVATAERRHGARPAEVRAWGDKFYVMMARGEFLPNTPTLMNAGTRLGQLSACFVLPVPDSVEGIFDALKHAAQIHKSGGGTGFDFSDLRPAGSIVSSTGGTSSGPVSFMHIFDMVTDVIRQGGKRRGANMGVLRVDHPDIMAFITAKLTEECLQNFNVSVAVTDSFMRAAMANKKYDLVDPHTKRHVGKLNASQVFYSIVQAAWRTGDPGVLFIDEINRRNPTRHLGRIASTNPCGEVPLHPYESCNLGSINLATCVSGPPLRGRFDWPKLRDLTRDAVTFLDDIIEVNRYPIAECAAAAHANRRIGLGVMGFAEALARLGLAYDSDEAVKFGSRVMAVIEREGHAASARLAARRGSFPNFRGSLWQKRGARAMRNATVTTIAPTGSISVIAGCSSGIEPFFAISFVRHVLDGRHLIETIPVFLELARHKKIWTPEAEAEVAASGSVQRLKGLTEGEKRLFRTALEIPVRRHIEMQAAFQKHVDNAVSKTINLPAAAKPEDVREAYLRAWRQKCKGVTIYRYGSKAQQVLTVGAEEAAGRRDLIGAESEYAGGCTTSTCVYSPS
ncbi:MAG: adenosylcobalamin-dependent ribonucleoside-diphosphate reductase [Patescibacteria group bacterium]|nr:adenosylcobalamin-dependent ribonucleoside-diphosphate reductase [Patescibacteria group bacterium]